MIARIYHHDILTADQVIPVFRVDMLAGINGGVDTRLAHGHDFIFEPHFHAQKSRAG